MKIREINHEKSSRKDFAKVGDFIEMPNLIKVQKDSYDYFIKEGLGEVLKDISPIEDYSGNLVLEFFDYYMEDKTKYSVEEAKERDATYSARLHVKVRLINRETGEIKEQEIYLGDFPLMTDSGTFIINGAERVVVSQLVRSPGCYYGEEFDTKTGKKTYTSTVMPLRGAWLEYETDGNDIFWVRVDRTRKVPITTLLRAIGLATDSQMFDFFGDEEMLKATLNKDTIKDQDEALIEIYKKLRPGELPTVDAARNLFNGLFFDNKRYDLAKVGRYKYNQKLSLASRIKGKIVAEDVIDNETGEVFVNAGETITEEVAEDIQNAGINTVDIMFMDKKIRIIGNGTVDIHKVLPKLDLSNLHIKELVNYNVLQNIIENTDKKELAKIIEERMEELVPKHITTEDMLASINFLFNLSHGLGGPDDIDHLANRRIRCVGELLQNQFRIGLTRLERVVRERMTIQDLDVVTPQTLINTKPITSAIREFFGSSQLSQFMDQTNPLSELTHKRKISALGPGGLTRERAGFEVRDVHYTHYGRLCPIESPEGPNIGLISALSSFAQINEYGFIETPYRKVDPKTHKLTDEVEYMSADVEDNYIIAQASEPVDKNGKFVNKRIRVRRKNDIIEVDNDKVQYVDVSPKQLVSVAAAMIPFLEHDDAKRALMGANMQRQAVPLMTTESPIVGTGIEYRAAKDSGILVLAEDDGVIEKVTGSSITVKYKNGKTVVHKLRKFKRTNGGTCINQKPIVKKGEKVKKGDAIADGPATSNGEMALGKNVLVAFSTWEGYNYEDAILINERLVKEDTFTSIHIEEYDCECRDTKLGAEEITRDIPNIGDDSLKDLDENGIIRIGAEVRPGDILVGKVTPKGETELTAEERLLRAIFGEKAREVRDTSLRVPHGEAGTVVEDVKIFTRDNSDELGPGVNQIIRCYIATKRKISVGDKMAGRHGNKGVISRVLPEEDMPFMPDGTPIDILLNPLGVPSRMNLGQVLEVHLGGAAKALGWKISTPVFDGANEDDVRALLKEAGMSEDGKTILYDGRTGDPFDKPITVGVMYMLKLHHLVDDKIHARSTGPYSLVTQQPLGGKAQFGGQRFGEMEVWALEAYGAAYTLQEMLTVKSDDVVGRVNTYEAIVKGENIPEPGVPESFKVLVKELQSLGLDVRLYSEDNEELELKEEVDEGIEYDPSKDGKLLSEEEILADGDLQDGYTEETEDDVLMNDEDDVIDDGKEDLFEELDDEGEEMLFGNDIANDNLDDDDEIE